MRLAVVIAFLAATPVVAESVIAARFDDPTKRYQHGILGDAIEHGALVIDTDTGRRLRFVLPETRVFEDTEPRLVDVDADGQNEVIVVETDLSLGARLIGRANRWLAPVGVGAADLDGDGTLELAYIDRPHLAKTLRIYRFQPGKLEFLAEFPGVTNHRIGETDIAGGIRDCGSGPEMIVADADWQRVLAVQFDGTEFSVTDLGRHQGRDSFAAAMACRR